MNGAQEALVIKSTGLWYTLLLNNSEQVQARLRGKLKLSHSKLSNPIAVGDKVVIVPENEQNRTYQITDVLPRKNYIIRKSVHKNHQSHILAANLDLAVIVATLVMPVTSTGFIDRFLVTAEAYDIPAMVVFNKMDLLDDSSMPILAEYAEDYTLAGYRVLCTSTITLQGISELFDAIKGKVTLISGHSGVGKSSIINILAPNRQVKVGELSEFTGKGKHTTTYAEMYTLPENTLLIDTPGIKELGLTDMEFDNLGHFFPEIRKFMNNCKFNNCTHTHEPECAVMEAINEGKIPLSRYKSYLSMLENDDNRR